MRIKLYRISLAVVLVLVIIASILTFHYMTQNKKAIDENAFQMDEYMYYLKEYEDKIGIYRSNESSPFRTLDVYVQTLPSVDQQELKSGVPVQNDANLQEMIEDYES